MQSNENQNPEQWDVALNGENGQDVEKFVYLGATVDSGWRNRCYQLQDMESEKNIHVTEGNIEGKQYPRKDEDLAVDDSGETHILLYGCETQKMNKGNEKKINIFQIKMNKMYSKNQAAREIKWH